VHRAIYAGLDRTEHALAATLFVVGGGGVETPRLLLLSAGPTFSDGLANRSGLVARGFMEHPSCATRARVAGQSYAERISFYTATCNQFWNTANRGTRAAFSVQIPPGWGEAPMHLVEQSGLWGDELSGYIQREFGHSIMLESPIEMLPDERNQIDLDPDLKDYFGSPAPRIRLGIGSYELGGMREAQQVHARLLAAHGATDVVHEPEVLSQSHHGGTCRMGDDPRTSVVDRNLRCHDVPNLYLIGSSVFVTMGLANPTLTIVALALRLADHLIAHTGEAVS